MSTARMLRCSGSDGSRGGEEDTVTEDRGGVGGGGNHGCHSFLVQWFVDHLRQPRISGCDRQKEGRPSAVCRQSDWCAVGRTSLSNLSWRHDVLAVRWPSQRQHGVI